MPRRNADSHHAGSRRWVGWLWYRGEGFCGFQRQGHAATIQGTLEDALREVGATSTVVGAGRTDRGVHARMQVIACRLPDRANGDGEAWRQVLAARLPASMGLAALRPAPTRFHPQFSASAKSYRYRLNLGCGPRQGFWTPALDPRLAGTLSPEAIAERLREAVGTRDFFAFHPSSSPRRPRTLFSVEATQTQDGALELMLRGDGFARHQVRYLVGSAVATAAGVLAESAWRAALERAETIEGMRAPADGLTLWEVHYPAAVDPFTERERAELPGVEL